MVKNKTKQWNPHFFKPILSSSDQQLVIPISFRCNLESSDGEATLRSDNLGKTWRVKVEKMEFQDGWKEFAQEHDLKAGNFLVFRYEGGMAFCVMVFESTMCLREYTKACIREYTQVDGINGGGMDNLKKRKKDGGKEIEVSEKRNEDSGNSIEISEKSHTTSSNSERTSVLPSVKGHLHVNIKGYNLRKRGCRTVDAITDGEGMENPGKHKKDSRMEREICEHRNEESGNSTEISEKSDEERGNTTETSSGSDHTSNLPSVKKGQCCVKIKRYNLRKRGRRTVDAITDGGGMENLGKHKKDSRMEREICEHRNEESGNNTEISEQSDEERGNTIETSSSSDHTSNLPSGKKRQFCVKIKPYNLRKPGRVMIIPSDFARANSLTKNRVTLKGKKGRSWQVEIRHRKDNGQVYIGPGWAEFCDANRLNLGDICIFEIVLGGKKVLMEVTIFHSDGSVTDDDEAPSFCKTITRKKFLTLPAKFVRKNGLMQKLGLITLVDKTGSRWRVKLRYAQFDNRVSIGGGWTEFLVSNRLNIGDVCSFKLLSGGKNVVMEVTVSQHTK